MILTTAFPVNAQQNKSKITYEYTGFYEIELDAKSGFHNLTKHLVLISILKILPEKRRRRGITKLKLRSADLPIPAASYGVLRKFCHSPADCGNALSLRARFLTACSLL
jgi:hypothetical protein